MAAGVAVDRPVTPLPLSILLSAYLYDAYRIINAGAACLIRPDLAGQGVTVG